MLTLTSTLDSGRRQRTRLAGQIDGLQRDLDDIVVGEGASFCRVDLELLRAQPISQRVGGLLHQHRVRAVWRGPLAGRERRAVEDRGLVAQPELGERANEASAASPTSVTRRRTCCHARMARSYWSSAGPVRPLTGHCRGQAHRGEAAQELAATSSASSTARERRSSPSTSPITKWANDRGESRRMLRRGQHAGSASSSTGPP